MLTDDSPRVLLVDNYDSYTYNLYQLIGRVTGAPPTVRRHDELGPGAGAVDRAFSHIVISPGPGHPAEPHSIGGCLDLIRATGRPLLGVCLGHQAIGLAFGARVLAGEPRHGVRSRIRHDGREIFTGLPAEIPAVRYHSLAVHDLPAELEACAFAEDGALMGLRHRERPLHGVQFHPESVGSGYGDRLLANFLGRRRPRERIAVRPYRSVPARARLLVREATWREPEDVFVAHYADRPEVAWLDRRSVSYVGSPEGPRGHVLSTVDELEPGLAARAVAPVATDAPFEFRGGYLGYLGYRSPAAGLLYVERFLAFDHAHHRAYAAAVAGPGEEADARDWLAGAVRMVEATRPAAPPGTAARRSPVASTMDSSAYRAAFDRVQEHLRRGETYEVNLTYRLRLDCTADPVDLYRHLRRVNPAPQAAFLRIGDTAVLSSSPEQFVHIGHDRRMVARPIKGTLPRHPDPRADQVLRDSLGRDAKTYAENLMITDLLRNDLGRVCQLGTVQTPELLAVESHPTVHQLVSTVSGVLAPGVGPVAAVRAAFPPGSMTGAPKRRTMQIIDAVEADERGVYAGALGYFSLSGAVDLAVVIRTIVSRGTALSIGVGGGVVALSRVDDERAEAELKARALLAAIDRACGAESQAAIASTSVR